MCIRSRFEKQWSTFMQIKRNQLRLTRFGLVAAFTVAHASMVDIIPLNKGTERGGLNDMEAIAAVRKLVLITAICTDVPACAWAV